jgi:hypothetical protein
MTGPADTPADTTRINGAIVLRLGISGYSSDWLWRYDGPSL